MYDSVKIQESKHVEVKRFIIENCRAISIEETNETETKEKGKYIVNNTSKNSNWKNVSRVSRQWRKTSSNGMLNSIPKLSISKR
jgi:hypothetical protein